MDDPDFSKPNAEFDNWKRTLPAKHWAKYDLAACRLGWEAALEIVNNRLRLAAVNLINLLRQADPNGGEERHPEWPLQIRTAEDMAPELCAALNELQAASGWTRPDKPDRTDGTNEGESQQ